MDAARPRLCNQDRLVSMKGKGDCSSSVGLDAELLNPVQRLAEDFAEHAQSPHRAKSGEQRQGAFDVVVIVTLDQRATDPVRLAGASMPPAHPCSTAICASIGHRHAQGGGHYRHQAGNESRIALMLLFRVQPRPAVP
ncbi:MAG: hypothetical protein IPI44_11665 [Sulfuritalea sp.]|nr:hypothetical protein [Sulfuritalea sp.]